MKTNKNWMMLNYIDFFFFQVVSYLRYLSLSKVAYFKESYSKSFCFQETHLLTLLNCKHYGTVKMCVTTIISLYMTRQCFDFLWKFKYMKKWWKSNTEISQGDSKPDFVRKSTVVTINSIFVDFRNMYKSNSHTGSLKCIAL